LLVLASLISACGGGRDSSSSGTQNGTPTMPSRQPLSLLYILNAEEGSLSVREDGTFDLTLRNPSPTTVQFADRPARYSSTLATAALVDEWNHRFGDDPPNVAVVLTEGSEDADTIVCTALDPVLEDDELRLRVTVLESVYGTGFGYLGDSADPALPATFGAATLFIDAVGSTALTFSYTGGAQSVTVGTGQQQVPPGVPVTVEAWGGAGGSAGTAAGGRGGYASSTHTFDVGDVMTIQVGGQGVEVNNDCTPTGTGGGASAVWLNTTAPQELSQVLVIAGGGGGASQATYSPLDAPSTDIFIPGGDGGNGGGASGTAGPCPADLPICSLYGQGVSGDGGNGGGASGTAFSCPADLSSICSLYGQGATATAPGVGGQVIYGHESGGAPGSAGSSGFGGAGGSVPLYSPTLSGQMAGGYGAGGGDGGAAGTGEITALFLPWVCGGAGGGGGRNGGGGSSCAFEPTNFHEFACGSGGGGSSYSASGSTATGSSSAGNGQVVISWME
jgi:hypothetical protein